MDPMEVHGRRLDKGATAGQQRRLRLKEKAARRAPDGSFHFEETDQNSYFTIPSTRLPMMGSLNFSPW